MEDLFNTVEKAHKTPFWNAFCDCVGYEKTFCVCFVSVCWKSRVHVSRVSADRQDAVAVNLDQRFLRRLRNHGAAWR